METPRTDIDDLSVRDLHVAATSVKKKEDLNISKCVLILNGLMFTIEQYFFESVSFRHMKSMGNKIR